MTAPPPRELTTHPPSTHLDVRVLAGHHCDHLVDLIDGVVRIRIVAVDDREINHAVLDCLADALDTDPDAITIIAGRHSTAKRLQIDGIAERDLDAMLSRLVPAAEVPHPDDLPLDCHETK